MTDTDPRKETWDEYWRNNPQYAPHEIIVSHVLNFLPTENPLILELGAGLGVDALQIASAGYTVIAMDISRESLKLIKSKSVKAGIDLLIVLGDALKLPFKKQSLDFIYHQGLMEHFKDPLPLLTESKTALNVAGRLLVDVPQTFTVYTFKKKWAMARGRWFAGWETQYTLRRLQRSLRDAGFEMLSLYGRDYDFVPLVWIRDITTLGKTRFGRPIIPRFISKPLDFLWKLIERIPCSNYLKHSIGAIAKPDESRD